MHLGHDRLLERRDEALECALHAERLLDLALEPCDLVLLGLVRLLVERDVELLGERIVLVGLRLELVGELSERRADEAHVLVVERRERLGVQPRSLLLEDERGNLLAERGLPLALERERLLRLRAPPGARDRVAIHAPRIIGRVTASKPPGVVLTGASAAQAAVSLVFFGLAAIGPELRADYDMSLFALGAVLGAGVLGSGIALVGAGIVVDRFGSRRAIAAGTALGTAGLVAAAFAPTTSTLFAAIALSGVGSAVVPIAGAGALFAAYPPAGRGWALGVRQMSVPLGGTIAALAYPALHAVGGSELTLLVSAAAVAATGLGFALVAPGATGAATERIARPFRAIV